MKRLFLTLLFLTSAATSLIGQSPNPSTNAPLLIEIRCKPVFEIEPKEQIELSDKAGHLVGNEVWTWLILSDGKQRIRVFWESRSRRQAVTLSKEKEYSFSLKILNNETNVVRIKEGENTIYQKSEKASKNNFDRNVCSVLWDKTGQFKSARAEEPIPSSTGR